MRINGYCTGRNGNSYRTWVDVYTVSQNQLQNYSIVNIKQYVQCVDFANSAFDLTGNTYRQMSVDGKDLRGSNGNLDTRNFQTYLLKDENYTVYHNIDGSKTIYIAADFYTSTNTLSGGHINGNYTLTTIPRVSQCTFNNFTLEKEDLIIKTNRSSPNFFHIIDVFIDENQILSRGDVADSITIKFSQEELDKIYEILKNKTQGTVRLNVSTWNGNTNLGYTSSLGYCFIDKELNKPEFKGAVPTYYYSDTLQIQDGINYPNKIIPGKTLISIGGIIFEPKNKATMKKLRLEIGGEKVEKDWGNSDTQSISLLYPKNNTNTQASLIAVDSRGIETSVFYGKELSTYYTPIIQKAVARRKNGVERETYLDLEIKIQLPKVDEIDHTILECKYDVDESMRVLDISSEILKGNYDEERQLLTVNDIQIHESGDGGGFEIGKSFELTFTMKNGHFVEGLNAIWDTVIFKVYIPDGKFLKANYKDYQGNYHSGYHCLPEDGYNHVFEGTVLFKDEINFVGPNIVFDGEEVKTGRRINGKDEYVKIISTDISSNSQKDVPNTLPSGSKIHSYEGFICNFNSETYVRVKDGFYASPNNFFAMHASNGYIRVITGSETGWIVSGMKCYITMYYTKNS